MYSDESGSRVVRRCARSSETKYTIGKSSAILQPRNPQRRSLVDQESFCEVTRYSPRGRDVVAGSARQARNTANRKRSFGPRVRSVRDAQAKSPIVPSGVDAAISQFSPKRVRSEERRVGKECRSRW